MYECPILIKLILKGEKKKNDNDDDDDGVEKHSKFVVEKIVRLLN